MTIVGVFVFPLFGDFNCEVGSAASDADTGDDSDGSLLEV